MSLNSLLYAASAVAFVLAIVLPREFPFMLVGLALLAAGHIPWPRLTTD